MNWITKQRLRLITWLTFALGCLISTTSSALEITVINPGPGIKPVQAKKVKTTYPLATTGDIVCGKDHHMVRFRLNDKHAGLPFSITAKRMTRVKVRWDHPDKVLFPSAEKRKTIVFPHAGGLSNLYFRSYVPVSGNVYLINDKNVVVQTCPYSFLPAKHFRQSISVNMGGSEYDSLRASGDSESRSISLNYRISSKQVVPEGSYWSWGVGVSQTENAGDSSRVNSSFSYNW